MVGGYFNHLEKYESQWEGLSHILWKKCLKPPTRYIYIYMDVGQNGRPRGPQMLV